MKLSLCITTYNRFELTMMSFEKVLNDDRISEIIIVDDCSADGSYEKIEAAVKDCGKIHLHRNEKNLGMSRNKLNAISLAKNEWCIIFDSDNIISIDYLNAFYKTVYHNGISPNTLYMPDAALPNFDFKKFGGHVFASKNVGAYMNDPMFRICLNTCNMVCHRETYLNNYLYDPTIKGTDTINHNLNHLKAGGSFYIVPAMHYEHLVHDGSGFRADMDYNMARAKEIENKIRQLS